jgi:predicted nucleic acid-binding protein
LVVDASVAFKWFLSEEPLASQALAVLQDGATLLAPDFLIAEVCNAAWRSAKLGRISQAQVGEIATSLPRFFDVLVSAAGLAPRAAAIAVQLDHPVYDCLYLALAEAEQAVLVTADLRLLGKVRTTAWQPRALSLSEYKSAGVRPAYGQDTSGPG